MMRSSDAVFDLDSPVIRNCPVKQSNQPSAGMAIDVHDNFRIPGWKILRLVQHNMTWTDL